MFAAYPYILLTMCLAMVYSHSMRLGYTSLPNASNFKSTVLNVFCFYPMALVFSAMFLALSPLALLLKLCGVHPKDKEQLKAAILPESVDSSKSEVFFRTEGGVLMTLDVERTATVPATIALVKDNLGFDFVKRTIHLASKGNVLPEDNQSMLSQFLLESGAVLDILVEPERVEIRIRLENGDTIVVNINGEETVSMLMEKIAPQCGIPASNQWLLLDNGPVLPSARLGELALLRQARLDMKVFELIITLNLQLPDESPAELSIRRDVSVRSLRQDIARQHQLEANQIELAINEAVLDLEITLHAAGVTGGTVVSVLQDIDVMVTLESGEELRLRISAYSSIESLMLELEGLTNIAQHSQFLLNNGQRVDKQPEAIVRDLESTSFELYPLEIELKLKLSSGEARRLRVHRDMTSSELLETIAEIEESEVDDLQVLAKASTLEVSESSLHSLGLRTNSALVVVRFIKLEIQLHDASQFDVRVKSGTTVRELKKQLKASSQLSPSEQFLVPQGQVESLQDSEQLLESRILLLLPIELPLRIQLSGGDMMKLSLRKDDLGEVLITAVAKLERVEKRSIRLVVNSRQIVSDRSLFAQGLEGNDIVVTTCLITLTVSFIKQKKDGVLEVVVDRDATIVEVKGALHEQLPELPIDRMFLTPKTGNHTEAVADGTKAAEFEKIGLNLFDAEIEVSVKVNAGSLLSAAKAYQIRLRRDDKGKTLRTRVRQLVGNKSASEYSVRLLLGNKEIDEVLSLHAQGVVEGSALVATFKKMTRAERLERERQRKLQREVQREKRALQRELKLLEKQSRKERASAREQLKSGNREQALVHLKKAKLYEKEAEKIQASIAKLSEQGIAIQSARTNAILSQTRKLYGAQKIAKNAQKFNKQQLPSQLQQELIDDVFDEQEEEFDDEELLKELEDLQVTSTDESSVQTCK